MGQLKKTMNSNTKKMTKFIWIVLLYASLTLATSRFVDCLFIIIRKRKSTITSQPSKRVNNRFDPLQDSIMFNHIADYLYPMEYQSLALSCKEFLDRMPGFSNIPLNDYVQQELSHPNLPLHRQLMLLLILKDDQHFHTLELPKDKDWIQQSFDMQHGDIAFELFLRGIRPNDSASTWIECLKKGYIELADWMLEESIVSPQMLKSHSKTLRHLLPSFIQQESNHYYQKRAHYVTEDLSNILEFFFVHDEYPLDAFLDLIFENNFFILLKNDVLKNLNAMPLIYQQTNRFLDKLKTILDQSEPHAGQYQDLIDVMQSFYNHASIHANLVQSIHEIQLNRVSALSTMAQVEIRPFLSLYSRIQFNSLTFTDQWNIVSTSLQNPTRFILSFLTWLSGLPLNEAEKYHFGSMLKSLIVKNIHDMFFNRMTFTTLVYLIWKWSSEPKKTMSILSWMLDSQQISASGEPAFIAFLTYFLSESTSNGQHRLAYRKIQLFKSYLTRANVLKNPQFWFNLEESLRIVFEPGKLAIILGQLSELKHEWI